MVFHVKQMYNKVVTKRLLVEALATRGWNQGKNTESDVTGSSEAAAASLNERAQQRAISSYVTARVIVQLGSVYNHVAAD